MNNRQQRPINERCKETLQVLSESSVQFIRTHLSRQNISRLIEPIQESAMKWIGKTTQILIPDPTVNDDQSSVVSIDKLSSIVINSNWKLPPSRMPHLMVHYRGDQIEEISQTFVEKIQSENRSGVRVTQAGEMEIIPRVSRPIRIVHHFTSGHMSTTDVVFKHEGRDLYVKFNSQPRTMLTYLKFIWRSGMFAFLFVILFSIYLMFTGSKTSWIQDYVAKYSNNWYPFDDKSAFMSLMIYKGHYTTDWIEFRNKIRSDKKTVKEMAKYSQDKYLQARKKMESLAKSSSLAELMGMGEFMLLQSIANTKGEYIPDWLINTINENTRKDEYAAWWCDETTPFLGKTYHHIKYLEQVGDSYKSYLEFYFENNKELQKKLIGYYNECTTYERPWSYSQLFFADPKIALANFGLPASIFATFIGFFVWRAPLSWLRFPCKILRWPTPDDFNNSCQARNAWVERVFSETLFDMGINKTDILELSMGQSQS
jgi:hypothetical protein